jgi:hypothetical protein
VTNDQPSEEGTAELLKVFTADVEWALSRRNYLRRRYPNRYIAVRCKRVIASSQEIAGILAKLREKNIEPNTVLIDFIPKDRVKYLLHN